MTSSVSPRIEKWLPYVGVGWHPLLIELDKQLSKTDPNYTIEQVKEKYGTLRFYVGELTIAGWRFVEDAEKASETTCELCGNPGETRSGGWLKTLCDLCVQDGSNGQ